MPLRRRRSHTPRIVSRNSASQAARRCAALRLLRRVLSEPRSGHTAPSMRSVTVGESKRAATELFRMESEWVSAFVLSRTVRAAAALVQVFDLALVLGHAAGDALADRGVDDTLGVDDLVGPNDAALELLVGT